MPILAAVFFTLIGLASLAASFLFGLFTFVLVCTLIGTWRDQEFSLKERFSVTALFSFVITWGTFLAYISATNGWAWLHHYG